MRVAVLVFFTGCATSGVVWVVTGWAERTVHRHVTRALDPRIARGLELAKGEPDFAAWEAELARPYDWEREGL